MPKPKLLLKGEKKKGKQGKQSQPTTADEYLEAGVDFEEAGEKWRGGDAVKSTRFFLKAITCYEEALTKFPGSFDLAYNKARVQYEITQYPKLLEQLPGSLIELLQVALSSSRYALALKQDNPEALYTTAQVLSSSAEAGISSLDSNFQALPLLEESLALFQQCLSIQEGLLLQSQILQKAAQEQEEDITGETENTEQQESPSSSTATQEERWATIVEPVSHETLLDTMTAQLEVLTQICALLTNDDGKIINFIDEYSSTLLQQKLPAHIQGASPDTALTATVTAGTFVSSFSEVNFQQGRIDATTYFNTLQKAWEIEISTNAEGLVSAAESLISFNASIQNHHSSDPTLQWKSLSSAQDLLTTASKLPKVDRLGKIYLLRGDVELLRLHVDSDAARKSGVILSRNAEKFYRGAKGLGEGEEASLKEALAKAFAGDIDALRELVKIQGVEVARNILLDSLEDGLVRTEELEAWGVA